MNMIARIFAFLVFLFTFLCSLVWLINTIHVGMNQMVPIKLVLAGCFLLIGTILNLFAMSSPFDINSDDMGWSAWLGGMVFAFAGMGVVALFSNITFLELLISPFTK